MPGWLSQRYVKKAVGYLCQKLGDEIRSRSIHIGLADSSKA